MTTAAAVSALRQHQVTNRFREGTAFAPDSAMPFTPADDIQRRWFERLRADKVIRSDAPGLYWLDQAALAQQSRRRKLAVIVVLAALAVVLGAGLAFGLLR